MTKPSIFFYYDVVSPYSWLAFEVLQRYQQRWGFNLVLKPAFMGGIMSAANNTPPSMNPSKGVYLFQDLNRLSKLFNVPLKAPKDFSALMRSTLPAQRLLAATQMHSPDSLALLTREMWKRTWLRDQPVGTQEGLSEAMAGAGIDEVTQKALLTAMATPDIKNQLKENTAEVLKFGAFGLPGIVVEVQGKLEFFFGSDRFELIAFMLGKEWHGPNPLNSKM
mmetsp:Transcript_24921/g.49032  ORF Transcript_24921/g.49032 Transcript_24921/m.49032 type:complete len:221 (-) Transcript_24921:170-832(-)